ncbi:MAG TPA: VOC family protein [Alphaproteobacteria bacterium]|jgi:catechol 2,3-dioxygenase-like lactoylglutathione lyase family enzyme
MPLQLLEHYTIRSADMEATRDFYCRAIGLRVGKRPPLAFPGYWLYCGETPVVHLVPLGDPKAIRGRVNVPAANDAKAGGGAVDHVAFRAENAPAMRRRLTANNIAFAEQVQPGGGLVQMFLDDPNGVTVEINFRNEKKTKRKPGR